MKIAPGRSQDRPPEPATRLLRALGALVAAVAAILPFLPSLDAQFVNLDDDQLFVDNPAFRGLDLPHLRWMFSTDRMGHYAPLAWVSAALDFQLFGLDARAFHRTNLVLHGINASLVYLLAVRLLASASPRARSRPLVACAGGLFAALLFGVHPLRTESVAWITERRGLLGALFLLATTLAWLRAFEPGRTAVASRTAYSASLALLALSLLSKGLGLTFAAVAVLLDVFPLRRLPGDPRRWLRADLRAIWVQKLPLLALGLASAGVSSWAVRAEPDAIYSLAQWPPLARVAQSGYGLAFYLWKTVWPASLCAVYEMPARFDALDPRSAVGLGVAVLFVPLVLALRRRAPAISVALAVYAVTLFPVLGFAQVGPQLVADRYSYVPCLSFAILAGGLVVRVFANGTAPWSRVAVAAACVATVILLARSARAQALVWHDSRSLWTHALAVGRPSSVAHNNLGALEGAAGRHASAADHFEASLALRPDQGRAWFNLGVIHRIQGRLAEAEHEFRVASETMTPAWDPLVVLGDLYLGQDRIDEAVRTYGDAIADVEARGPEHFSPLPYLGLGTALAKSGRPGPARKLLEFAAQFPETREAARAALGR